MNRYMVALVLALSLCHRGTHGWPLTIEWLTGAPPLATSTVTYGWSGPKAHRDTRPVKYGW